MAKLEGVQVKGRRSTTPSAPVAQVPATLNITKPGGSSHLKMVLFGPPGTGKTRAAVSGTGRKLLILTEPDGDLGLIGRDDIDVVHPTNGKELNEVVLALHQGAVANYEWVVLDSVTFAIEVVGRSKITRAIEANIDMRRPYGDVGAAVTQIVHDLVALPTNVVFTTQLRQDDLEDEEAGPEEGRFPFTMAVFPQVYKILAPAVSVRGRTFKRMFVNAKGNKEAQFMVSFEDFGKSPAGSRIEVPAEVQDLQLDTLVEALERSKQ